MDPVTIGYLAFGLLFFLLVLGIPIGFAMAVAGLSGTAGILGIKPALALFGSTVYETTFTYELSIIPLFVLMGAVAARSGLSKELYAAFYAWFGAFRGGLALATIGACGAFAAICGSSIATAATMSRVALPEMKRFGYADSLATGSVAAGGIIGILIPPSVILVLYGILTQTSIGDLFIAGFIPGILTVVGFMIAISIITHIWPDLGPAGDPVPMAERFRALGRTWGLLLLFGVVIGGIYFGVFTPTEAAGIGACGAFIISIIRGRLTWSNTREALFETITMSAMIFVILIGALTLNNMMVFSQLVDEISSLVGGMDLSPAVTMAVILLIYMVMGCFLDAMAMVLLTVPIFFPIVLQLGYDPVWFGVIVVMVVELGMISPPIGMNVFVIKSMADNVSLGTIYRGVMPFVVAQILLIIAVFLVPDIILWLPETARAFR